MKKLIFLIYFVFFCLSYNFSQSTYQTIGNGALGKAYVGDSLINPANLGYNGTFIFNTDNNSNNILGNEIFFNYNTTITGDLLYSLDYINDIIEKYSTIESFQQKFQTNTPGSEGIQDATRLVEAISILSSNNSGGAFTTVDLGLEIFFKNIGFYINIWGHGGIKANIDYNNIALENNGNMLSNPSYIWNQEAPGRELTPSQQELADLIRKDIGETNITEKQAQELVYQAVIGGVDVDNPFFRDWYRKVVYNTYQRNTTIDKNTTGYVIRTLMLQEYTFSYGHKIFEIFSAGISFKIVHARLYEKYVYFNNILNGEEILNDIIDYIDERDTTKEKFNLDLGISARPLEGLSVGIYARNLIPYSYKYPSGYNVDINTHFRAGISYSYKKYFKIAFDIDLNTIHYDTIGNYKERILGGGIEFTPISKGVPLEILLRLGAYKNIEESSQDGVFTGGITFKYWKFKLNLDGEISFRQLKIQKGGDDLNLHEIEGFNISLSFITNF